MRTRTKIYLSGAAYSGVALWAGKAELAAIAFATHVLILFLHNIEVKVNRLLDEQGIRVTDEELAD